MIRLDSYYIADVGAGYYCGPPLGLKGVLDTATSWLKRMWGDNRPTLVVEPVGKTHSLRMCLAWLNGPEVDPEDHGTHLFVIWFTDRDADPKDPLADALSHVEANGGWEKLAKGWQF